MKVKDVAVSVLGWLFWLSIVLAFTWTPWCWLVAGAVWAVWAVLRIAGARDVFAELVGRKIGETMNRRAEAEVLDMLNPDERAAYLVPPPFEEAPSASRGQFWTGLGSGAPETAAEREARERADYELLISTKLPAMRRHPAGGPDRPAS